LGGTGIGDRTKSGVALRLPPHSIILVLALVAMVWLWPLDSLTAAQNEPTAVTFKWGRLEQTFKSSVEYSNPFRDTTLRVLFISPQGQTYQIYGFWDGGKTWRARFSPDQLGRWSFKTTCSDPTNNGLHNQAGEFVCTTAAGPSRFNQHGPVRVARDHRHFEHADGSPFFWLADSAWNGARVSALKDWAAYASVRAAQKFTVVQWAVLPAEDSRKQSAFVGSAERSMINPEFFKRLDEKLEALSRAGLLSAIAPLWPFESPAVAKSLSDEQALLLVRYLAARWGAGPVVWLMVLNNGDDKGESRRWNKIVEAAFADAAHAPIILYTNGKRPPAELRNQRWVDALSVQVFADLTDDALKALSTETNSDEWKKEPIHPLVMSTPCENGLNAHSGKRCTGEEVRRAAYWSLLMVPPAGLSYAGQGTMVWDTTVDREASKSVEPAWYKSLFMPAAKEMGHLAEMFTHIEFWRLRPQPGFLWTQPGSVSPHRYVAAAAAEAKDLALVYVPEDRTLEIRTEALPPSPSVMWFNPRTGETSVAVAVVAGSTCQFPTPDPGDWVLITNAGR
jgi:hypothetical protein